MKQYQNDEDRIAREAMETALSEIKQGRPSVTHATSSITDAVRQEKSWAEEVWVC